MICFKLQISKTYHSVKCNVIQPYHYHFYRYYAISAKKKAKANFFVKQYFLKFLNNLFLPHHFRSFNITFNLLSVYNLQM